MDDLIKMNCQSIHTSSNKARRSQVVQETKLFNTMFTGYTHYTRKSNNLLNRRGDINVYSIHIGQTQEVFVSFLTISLNLKYTM